MDLRAEGGFYTKGEPYKTAEQNAEVNGLLIGLSLIGNQENLIDLMEPEQEENDSE